VRPTNRHLHGSQAVVPGKIEQFGIKPKPFDSLLLKNDLTLFAPERLEPALCVHEWQPQDHSHNPVENESPQIRETRIRGPRSARDSPAREPWPGHTHPALQATCPLPLWEPKIRVRKKNNLAARLQRPAANTVSLPTILPVWNDPNIFNFPRNDSATRAVLSIEPSSTTITSVFLPEALM